MHPVVIKKLMNMSNIFSVLLRVGMKEFWLNSMNKSSCFLMRRESLSDFNG